MPIGRDYESGPTRNWLDIKVWFLSRTIQDKLVVGKSLWWTSKKFVAKSKKFVVSSRKFVVNRKVCAVILGGRHKSSKTRRLSPFTEFVV
jgi:hypothetical protein